MLKAYVFPGQGAQFVGMGKDLYESNPKAKELFDKTNEILGYRITDIMFEGTDEDIKQTKVTQPAVFLHSVITAFCLDDFMPDIVAIEKAPVNKPICLVYQNVDALPHTDSKEIKDNLLKQLIAPVRWTQNVINMLNDGMTEFVECGSGTVLTGLIGSIQ